MGNQKDGYKEALEALKVEHRRQFESRKPVGMLDTGKGDHGPTAEIEEIDFSSLV